MKSVEFVPDTGITIVREAIDRVTATEFQVEWLDIFERTGQLTNMSLPAAKGTRFFSDGFDVERMIEGGKMPATTNVVALLKLSKSGYPYNLTVNYQPAFTGQDFHKDNLVDDDMVIVVHGGDQGAFDFATVANSCEQAEDKHETVELEAGDVLFHRNPYIFHRGRNTGPLPRVTATLARVLVEQFYDSQR